MFLINVEIKKHIHIGEVFKIYQSIRNAKFTLIFNFYKNLFNFFTLIDDLSTKFVSELLCCDIFFDWSTNRFKLFLKKFFSQYVIFVYLWFNPVFVAVVEDSQHEIEKHIKTNHQESNKIYCCKSTCLPEWKQDIWKVWCSEQDVHI